MQSHLPLFQLVVDLDGSAEKLIGPKLPMYNFVGVVDFAQDFALQAVEASASMVSVVLRIQEETHTHMLGMNIIQEDGVMSGLGGS
jgi:hypothetical protein